MGIRRHDGAGFAGYGVIGGNYTSSSELITLSLQSEAQDAWNLYRQLNPGNGFQVAGFVSMQWRFSVQVFSFSSAKLQIYNARISKYRIGSAIITAYNYVTEEVFVPFPVFKSARYSCAFRFIGEDLEEDDIPCDEPQNDVSALFTGGGGAQFYSHNQPSFVGSPQTWQNDFQGNIGDKVMFALEPAIFAFTVGITYIYRVYGYDENWVDFENSPPLVIV